MKVAVIPWETFWQSCGDGNAMVDSWIRRWVFADDGVRLSIDSSADDQRYSRPLDKIGESTKAA